MSKRTALDTDALGTTAELVGRRPSRRRRGLCPGRRRVGTVLLPHRQVGWRHHRVHLCWAHTFGFARLDHGCGAQAYNDRIPIHVATTEHVQRNRHSDRCGLRTRNTAYTRQYTCNNTQESSSGSCTPEYPVQFNTVQQPCTPTELSSAS